MSLKFDPIATIIQEYIHLGYHFIQVPYYVEKMCIEETMPSWCVAPEHDIGNYYVGSGEQSFLQMINNGEVKEGKYMCITPCYRDEEKNDDLHLRIFLKVELINVNSTDYNSMIADAKSVLQKFKQNEIDIRVIDENSSDLEYNGIEIGSYGKRNFRGTDYVFGTGVAFPRFQQSGD